MRARFTGAVLLAFMPLFWVQPAYASDWQTDTGNVVNGSVQFSYYQGSAIQTLDAPEGSSLTLTVNNTVSNRIGWGEPLSDIWSVSINGQVFSGDSVGVTTLNVPVSGPVVIVVSGIDRGYWAGWYGPIFTAPTITAPVIVEPVTQDVIRPVEPAPEPSPSPIQPSPEPITPAPSPEPSPPVIEPAPQPAPEPAPAPEPQPEPAPKPPAPAPEPPAPEPSPPPVEPSLPAVEPTPPPVEPLPELPPAPAEVMAELAAEARADDPVLPEALVAIPLLGDAAAAVLDAFNALGNVGADMTPEVRKKSEEVVVASVIVGQVATAASSAAVSAASVRRKE